MPCVGDPSLGTGKWCLDWVRERIICLAVWSHLVSELGNPPGVRGLTVPRGGYRALAVRRTWCGGLRAWDPAPLRPGGL